MLVPYELCPFDNDKNYIDNVINLNLIKKQEQNDKE